MNDDWKYKELPRASGQVAPAQWNPETGEWEVFTGLAKVQDVEVEARLQAIESKQQAILDKLESGLDTRLTGSYVEYLPTQSLGNRVEQKKIMTRNVRSAFTQAFDTNVDPAVKSVIIVLNVYGVTGTFNSGDGYALAIRRHTRDTVQAYDVARTKHSTLSGNYGGALITIDPTVGDKINGQSDNYLLVQDTLFPSYRIMLYVDGVFGEGEGVDCDVSAYYIY